MVMKVRWRVGSVGAWLEGEGKEKAFPLLL